MGRGDPGCLRFLLRALWKSSRASASGTDSRLERSAIIRDVARSAFPEAIDELVRKAVLQRFAQRPQPERIAEQVRMDRHVEDERMLRAFLDHFFELIDG